MANGIYLLGGIHLRKLPPRIANTSLALPEMVQVFHRAELHGQVFYSQEYGRVKSRNSYTVAYKEEDQSRFGLIQYFFLVSHVVFAVIKPLAQQRGSIDFLHPCRSSPVCVNETDRLVIVNAEFLLEKVLFIVTPLSKFVIKFPQVCTWLIPD